MIHLNNTQYMTSEQRQMSLQRALHSQPFYNLLDFEVIATAVKRSQYGAKAQVDKDFYVTEVKGNFGQVLVDAQSLYTLSLYIANSGQSLFQYIAGENLPTAFQTSDIRDTLTVANQSAFCDLQREIMPTLIKRGDNIIARTQNVQSKQDPADIKICLSGYYPLEKANLTGRTQEGIDESLKADIRFEEWKFNVDYTGQKNHIFNNDRTARMVLGFGIVLANNETAGHIPTGNVQINDPYRGIRFNNLPMNIAFFAPKLNQVQDTSIYYLPVEYFWQPFAPLRFEISNALNSGNGYQWVMLTRTV